MQLHTLRYRSLTSINIYSMHMFYPATPPPLYRPTETQVVASFDEKGEGCVSLPKFLRFLGKEYGRGGAGGAAPGGGLEPRLRLILKKVMK